jgi:hypothetical protein
MYQLVNLIKLLFVQKMNNQLIYLIIMFILNCSFCICIFYHGLQKLKLIKTNNVLGDLSQRLERMKVQSYKKFFFKLHQANDQIHIF